MYSIEEILAKAISLRSSDVHITVELPPMVRLDGDLVRLDGYEVVKKAEAYEMFKSIVTHNQLEEFTKNNSLDFSLSVSGLGRFRVNAYMQRGSVSLALRIIPMGIPDIRKLNLPPVISELARKHSGLILVTGVTGSGKSTTLAAMIGQMNREEKIHILTLEDPIEFLHKHETSMVNQREIGQDCPSFAAGLRAALREDPDVILVGEMRDYDTTQIAISAAETGHLVLATLHTPSACQTIDRIIDIFPPFQQAQIRIQLAASLQGVIAQQLLPRADGKGRVAAFEILVANPAIRNLVREGKTHQLHSVLQTGAKSGMLTMEASLKSLLESKQISDKTYKMYSTESNLLSILG